MQGLAASRAIRRLGRAAWGGRLLSTAPASMSECVGLDIGGSLAKVVLFEPEGHGSPALARLGARMASGLHPGYESRLSFSADGGRYVFLKFETRWMEEFMGVLNDLEFPRDVPLWATGGGAFKFASAFKERLGATLTPVDEMEALVRGFRFCHQVNQQEAFWYDLAAPEPGGRRPWSEWEATQPPPSPSDAAEKVLLVNIGSGVSVLKIGLPRAGGRAPPPATRSGRWVVPAVGVVERISGCSVGGATFWGLARLLTRARSFDDAVAAAGAGDNTRVSMQVRDIYGGEYGKLGLPGDLVAADFGKISTVDDLVITDASGSPVGHVPPAAGVAADYPPTDIHGSASTLPHTAAPPTGAVARSHVVSEADVTRGLLVLVLNNIAQVAFMNAQAAGVQRIFFTGGFLREGIMMRVLTSALRFWSAGTMQAGFLSHETYFGALGALLAARTPPP